MKDKRVVITGTGIISSIGNSTEEFWNSLMEVKSGIGPITNFDATDFRTKVAGEVKDFDVTEYMTKKEARKLDPFCQFAIAASDEAIKQAGLDAEGSFDPERVGVLVGSGIGGMSALENLSKTMLSRGPGRVSPFTVPMMIGDMASGNLSIRYGFKGPNFGVVSACATATHSIGEAWWMIKRGDADIMLAGGAEACVTEQGMAGFCAMKAMSERNDDPLTASRPFDKDRDGFVMCEGAGILVLESLENAEKRGATILAELVGYGATGDAGHITAPDENGTGAAKAMTIALEHAGLKPEDVDYYNAHGTSTPLNDKFETKAVKRAFGDHAYKLAISSTKGLTGHGLGAAGGLETIACIKAINESMVPCTANYTTPDEDCDLDIIPNTPRKMEVNVAMNMNLGFGGHNGAVIVKKFVK